MNVPRFTRARLILLLVLLISILSLLVTFMPNPSSNQIMHQQFGREITLNSSDDSLVLEEYCNQPSTLIEQTRGEGIPPTNDYALVSVQVVIRHGNRLPMDDTPDLGPFKALISISCKISESTTEKIAPLLTLYKDKTSKSAIPGWELFPLMPDLATCPSAALTQIGVEQHLILGHQLSEAYGAFVSSLLDYETKSNSFYPKVQVFSTSITRTIQSAVAFLHGFLPKVNLNEITMFPVSGPQFCESYQGSYLKCSCDKLSIIEETIRSEMLAGGKVMKEDVAYQRVHQSIRRSVNIPQEEDNSIWRYPWKSVHDFMALRLCRKLPLPCNNEACLTAKQSDLNWNSLKYYYKRMSENSEVIKLAALEMLPFWQGILDRMMNQTGNKIDERFTLYSGHDNTITPLLLALGIPLTQWPPFASILAVELYKGESDYAVKVLYNGKDVTEHVTACAGLKLCSLDLLMQHQATRISTFDNFKSYCEA